MKIVVITRHAIINYGSLLQAMATQQIIQNMGHECQIIDYVRDDENYRKREYTLLKRKPEWYNNIFKRILYLIMRQPESFLAGRRFEKYQKKYLNLTRRYTEFQQLKDDKPAADIYLTGSDQVWGPVENGSYDSSYCLAFAGDYDKKIAYAASFGYAELTPKMENYYSKWLSKYAYVAVREDSAVKMLRKINIESKQVLDPTLLLDVRYWERYMTPIEDKDYILVYQLHNNKNLGLYAKKVAKMKGLKLIRISTSFHQIIRQGRLKWSPDLGEFLSYIKNAKCMITDSFHGTAFAINFNTPFIEFLPDNSTEDRNVSILSMTGLTHRIARNLNDAYLINEEVDFSKVNYVIEKYRNDSLEVFKNMIRN